LSGRTFEKKQAAKPFIEKNLVEKRNQQHFLSSLFLQKPQQEVFHEHFRQEASSTIVVDRI